jgi:hypothetical protein
VENTPLRIAALRQEFRVNVKARSADGWAMWGGNAAHNGWEE